MELSNTTKNAITYLPGALALLLFVAFGFQDFWAIGVVADPAVVERYNFGAEAMIAQGGDKYRSANSYAVASLVI